MDTALAREVRQLAGQRCEYCRMPQAAHVFTFPIDHIIAQQHGGPTTLDNLVLSCVRCNSYKGLNIAGLAPDSQALTRLFHPRRDDWDVHFSMQGNVVVGLSDIGRATVELF